MLSVANRWGWYSAEGEVAVAWRFDDFQSRRLLSGKKKKKKKRKEKRKYCLKESILDCSLVNHNLLDGWNSHLAVSLTAPMLALGVGFCEFKKGRKN